MRSIALSFLAIAMITFGLASPARAEIPEGTSDVRIVLDDLPAKVRFGTGQPVSGKLEGLVDGAWRPLVGEMVYLAAPGNGTGTHSQQGGRFLFDNWGRVTKPLALELQWDGALGTRKAVYEVAPVPLKLKLAFRTLNINARGYMNVRALAAPIDGQFIPDRLRLQRKVGPGKWKNVRWVNRWEGNHYLAENFYTGSAGTYRVQAPASAAFAPSVSPARTLNRWRTKFSKIKAAPKKVAVGRKTTVTGTLYRWSKGRAKYGFKNQKVKVVFRCKGSKTWYSTATGRTDARGRFRIPSKTYCDAYFAVQFAGSKDTFVSGSKTTYVDTTGTPLLRPHLTPATRIAL